MKKLDNQYIVKLCGVYETNYALYIVMEYSCGCNMHEFIFNTHRKYSRKEARLQYRQLILALEYLQRNKIVHR